MAFRALLYVLNFFRVFLHLDKKRLLFLGFLFSVWAICLLRLLRRVKPLSGATRKSNIFVNRVYASDVGRLRHVFPKP